MTWLTWFALAAGSLLTLTAGLSALGSARWAQTAQLLNQRLASGRVPKLALRYAARELTGLPAPVQRYFEAVLTDGQAIVTAANIEMAGSFNLSTTGEQWRPFTSRQRVSTHRPGFLWDARIAMLPGVAVHVIDSYIVGVGCLKASLLGLFKVADLHGGDEIARGELMRYFAEAVWYPTALLPSQGVQWQAVDAHSANATLVDGPIALTLLFRFDDAGLIESFRAESRGALVGKAMVHAPWEGRFWRYQAQDGMLMPFAGEVAWMRPAGRQTYFKGCVTLLRCEFSA